MDRILQQRVHKVEKLISKAEEYVSIALRKRAEDRAASEERLRPRARLHATAVAAIVVFGNPKIDEPLIRAWGRTLRRHRITVRNEYGREYEYEEGHEYEYESEHDYERELLAANRELYPAIMKGGSETEKFTKIFRTAPIWLLEFPWMRVDAELLKFDLPQMSEKQIWGTQGFEETMLRWPLLPLGMMTDGDLLPEAAPDEEEDARQRRWLREYLKPSSAKRLERALNRVKMYDRV